MHAGDGLLGDGKYVLRINGEIAKEGGKTDGNTGKSFIERFFLLCKNLLSRPVIHANFNQVEILVR